MVPTVEADDGNVSVKYQRGRGGKPRPSGFVECITQHRLENPLRLRGFQFMGLGKGLDPAQGPGCLGIFVSAWQRHQDTDTQSYPISLFNSFFTHLHDFFQNKTELPKFLCKWRLLSNSLSLALAASPN